MRKAIYSFKANKINQNEKITLPLLAQKVKAILYVPMGYTFLKSKQGNSSFPKWEREQDEQCFVLKEDSS